MAKSRSNAKRREYRDARGVAIRSVVPSTFPLLEYLSMRIRRDLAIGRPAFRNSKGRGASQGIRR